MLIGGARLVGVRGERVARFVGRYGYPALAIADSMLAAFEVRSPIRAVTKSALMPALAARLVGRDVDPTTLALVGAGLGTSWAGDVALLTSGERAFVTGLTAFLTAHGCYLAGFARSGGAVGLRSQPLLAAPAAGIAALGAATLLPAAGRLAGPVAAYLATISAMAAAASGTRSRTAIAGAALYCVSDFLLALNLFRGPMPRWVNGLVMATYTAGQWLILDALTATDSQSPTGSRTRRS